MVRQTKRYSALVPLLMALLFAVLLPATAPAGHPGDGRDPTGAIRTDPWAGAGGGGGEVVGSGDPDELGIYSVLPPPGWNSGPVPSGPPRADGEPGALPLKLRILRAFLLGFRFPGF
jgi:hypothetical protein